MQVLLPRQIAYGRRLPEAAMFFDNWSAGLIKKEGTPLKKGDLDFFNFQKDANSMPA